MSPSSMRLARDVEAFRRGALGGDRLLQRDGIGLDRAQRIGDVLKCGDHRAAILRLGLIVRGLCRELPVQQRAAVEDRLGDAAGRFPKPDARREQLIDRERRAAGRRRSA